MVQIGEFIENTEMFLKNTTGANLVMFLEFLSVTGQPT